MTPEEQLRAWLKFGYECAHIERDDVIAVLAALDAARAEAQRERAAVVAFIRSRADAGDVCVEGYSAATELADRIERGEHEEEVRGG